MTTWHVYPTLSASMPFQMALDEILFRSEIKTVPMLRFYFASEPWITVGYSHRSENAPVLSGDSQWPVCRRMTGGGLVIHGDDLIFSLNARSDHDESFRSVRVSYLKIHEAVKWGLENLGNKIRFYRCDENLPRGEECFRFPIATDLAMDEQKIAGGAQKRSMGRFLHQESMQPNNKIQPEELMRAVSSGFETIFKISLVKADLHPKILYEAEKLANLKYRKKVPQNHERV